jgi:hypothetical protein
MHVHRQAIISEQRRFTRLIAAWTRGTTIAAIAIFGGCHSNDPVYFPGTMVLETDGMGTEVKVTVPLRFRQPSESESASRADLSNKLGYQVPWLREDRVHVEIRYTVRNLGDRDGQFSLMVDGASEYARFDFEAVAAAFEAADEEAPPLGLIQIINPPILAPGEVYQGIIREDDFREGAVDLDGMGRFMAPFVALLINRSEVNPIGLELTPSAPASDVKPAVPVQWILPALWEVTPRFTSDQPMTCEFLVRVRDDDGRLWDNGDDEFLPEPVTFTPTVMP